MAKTKNTLPILVAIVVSIFLCIGAFYIARKGQVNRKNTGTTTGKSDKISEDGTRSGAPGGGASHSRSTTTGKRNLKVPETGLSVHRLEKTSATIRPERKIGDKPFFTDLSNAANSGRDIHQRQPGKKRKVVKYREHDNLPRGTISGTITATASARRPGGEKSSAAWNRMISGKSSTR